MKRLAMLILLAAVSHSSAADLPLPTGMARTEPSVPAPVLMGGVPASAPVSFREKLGIGTTYEVPTEEAVAGPRLWCRMPSWRPCRACALFQAPTWCENCAPAVKRPLPPLPAGLSTSQCSTGNCATAPARASGSCCEKLKNWLCFHYTPVRIPLTPTAKEPALYTYFQTQERAGVCASGNCAAGHCAKVRVGRGSGCAPCPAPGEAIVPGYRLANPEK